MMDTEQQKAWDNMFHAGSLIQNTVIHAKSSLWPLSLPDEVVEKLIVAQEAVFAAQRLMEDIA